MPKQVTFTPDELATLASEGAAALAASFTNSMSQLHGRSAAISAKADRENRDLTSDEVRQCERLDAQFQAAAEKRDALDPDNNDVSSNIPARARATQSEKPLGHGGDTHFAARSPAPGGRRFRDMFQAQADPYGGKFRNLGEFCRAVIAGNDQRLMVTNAAMAEGVGTSGGFLVPEQWAWDVLDTALQAEAIRPRSLVLPMSSNVLNVPGFDYLDGTSNKRAGLLMTWGPEAGTLTEQQGKTRIVALTAKKATILVRVSSELTEDAVAFDVALSNAMTAAVSIGLDVAFIQGTGAGQPLGILNSPALITVAKEGGRGASFPRVGRASAPRPKRWQCNGRRLLNPVHWALPGRACPKAPAFFGSC